VLRRFGEHGLDGARLDVIAYFGGEPCAARRERRRVMSRSMNTVREERPMMTRNALTILAGTPMLFHISTRLNDISSPFRYAVSLNGI
jgi:hypothetical protein